MAEPIRARSRHALAGGVAAAVALTAVGFAIGRQTSSVPQAAATAPSAPIPTAIPSPEPTPVTDPVLDRAAVLAAVRQAADAAASGQPTPAELVALGGRRFAVRLPFGCRGPAPAGSALGWRYDADTQALRVEARPARFDPAFWLGATKGVDLIEGFWIERPWTSSEACPPLAPDDAGAAPPPPPENSVALAQVHRAGESRADRRDGEAFDTVVKVAPDALQMGEGLRLRTTGRLTAPSGGGSPVICRLPVPAGRPVCIVMVTFDEVAIENPATSSVLATWSAAGVGTDD